MQKHVCKFSFLVFFAVASAQMVLFYKMLLKLMSTFSSGFSQRFHFWLTGQYCNRYWSASHSQTFWTQVSFCQSKEKKAKNVRFLFSCTNILFCERQTSEQASDRLPVVCFWTEPHTESNYVVFLFFFLWTFFMTLQFITQQLVTHSSSFLQLRSSVCRWFLVGRRINIWCVT